MWKMTLKGLLAHRVRLVLTTLSVVLGVAFVAGTFVLTDTMSEVFDDIVRGGSQAMDVMVRSARAADTEMGSVDAYYGTAPLDADVLDTVAAVDGVEVAEGTVEGYALIVRPDGEPILPMGPPTLGASWSTVGGRIVESGGHAPQGPDEVVVDASTAERNGLEVGDRLEIAFATVPPRAFTLVGLSTAEGGENLAGASLAEFDLATAQQMLDREGEYTTIGVVGEEGLDPEVLTERVAAAVPDGVEAISAADWADETMAQIDEALAFITITLGVFAAIALLVGAFIIANTFSITVLQRSREFALLRALGASRRQIVAGVVGEALVIGLLASLVGILAGLGLASGLQALLSLFGMDMPSGALVVLPRTVAVSLGIGLAVTVVSALLPARRASAIHPVAAMRAVEVRAYRPSRPRLAFGIGTGVLAVGLLGYVAAAQPGRGAVLLAAGVLSAFVALALTGPILTRPVLRVLGGRGEHLGVSGHLARSNSMRTPRRTWTTAAALTVGVALVSGVAVISASMKASATGALDATLKADVIVSAAGTFTAPTLPPVVARQIAASPDIAAVSPMRLATGRIDGATAATIALDPTNWDMLHTTEVTAGSLAEVAPVGTVAVDADLAAERGYEVGDVVTATFSASSPTELRIVALYEPDLVLSGWVISIASSEQYVPQPLDAAVLVVGTGDAATTRAAVEAVTADYPAVTVQNQAEYRDSLAGRIDQMLALVTALLGMALVIAVLGIMNTLALSIHERTREIGLLRAVGMTRRQVRAMVRWEAVSVALLGASVGLVLGTLFGWVTIRVLAAEGMTAFRVPVEQLTGAVVVALLAGVLAATLPARTAARLDVMRAVTVE